MIFGNLFIVYHQWLILKNRVCYRANSIVEVGKAVR